MEILKDKVIYLAVVIGVVINLVLPFVLKRFATSDEITPPNGPSFLDKPYINVVLPFVLKRFATQDEISPPNGPSKLNMKEQVMHMFVHHSQVPVTSSVIIAIIVFLSVLLAKICCKKFLEKKE